MANPVGKQLALEIARLAKEKKAENLIILDLSRFNAPAEFYVIGTALSAPHLIGLRDHISQELKKTGLRALHADGLNQGTEWVVLDYFDVIIHLFSEKKRRYYDIEDLYADAPMEAYGLENMPAPTTKTKSRKVTGQKKLTASGKKHSSSKKRS